MRTKLMAVTLLAALAIPAAAQAQHHAYLIPLETGTVESGVDLQLHYSHLDLGSFGGTDISADVAILSVEAQYAFADRFEVGLNIPFVAHSSVFWGSNSKGDETHFGDIILDLKVKLVGTKSMGVSLFANTRLPTHSWDGGTREYAVIHTGGAVSLDLAGLRVGGGLHFLLLAADTGGDVPAILGLEGYVGYKLLGLLVLQLGLQYHNSISPNADLNVFALTPGAELEVKWFRVGLSTRIAITDEAEGFYGGRPNLLFHAGFFF